ncbi:MAG: type II toxin-antitoxin system VapC family toxin [Planctomycetes bacterium]|nr:type II toxin-antitoxin system VapC family toxin [Planctomycetota bacterium]
MIVYLDSSVVLRVLLRQRGALRSWEQWSEACASEILKVEARRVIDRLRLESLLDDEGIARAHEDLLRIERSIAFIGLTPLVLERASASMPTVIKTLDAIHLASALLYRERRGESIAFATHDDQQSTAARALGFRSIG